MQLSPTASRRTYVARRRSRIARGFLGLVSSLQSLAGSRGVACRCLLGPLAGSYRALVGVVSSLKSLAGSRGVVTLVGRSAGLRMCGKVGVWREIIDCVEKYLHRLATAPSFCTRIPLWLITARPRADTVPNVPNDSTE
jgi:hypothetical protein